MTECLADLAVLSSALLRKPPRDCSAVLEKKKIAPSPWMAKIGEGRKSNEIPGGRTSFGGCGDSFL